MEGAKPAVSTAEARLWEIVEEAAQSVTDEATGQFENKKLIAEIKAKVTSRDLPEHVRSETTDMLAKKLAEGFVRRRNPKPGKAATMFHPGAVLPLGDGKRVWMEYATDADLIEWARQSTKNLARVAAAEGSRQSYVAERLDAMRERPGWLLGQLEREVFGYEPDVEEPPFDEDDDIDFDE